MEIPPFLMERWQSLYEHRVRYNLSESGVEPLTVGEVLRLTGLEPEAIPLGYTQTNGTEALRERIAALYRGAGPENVVVTCGGAEANFLVLWHLLAPGDRVAVLEPTYGQTPGLAEGLGARVHRYWLREELEWQPEPGAAAEALGPEGRLLVVTNPNNPTGAVLSERAAAEAVEAASRAGAWLLADEVYAGAEADGDPTPSFWGRADRVLITGSLSKAYGLPGLRLGWVVGPEEAVRALWAIKDYTTIAPAALSDALAAEVMRADVRERVLERTRAIVRENRDRVMDWVDARDDLVCRPPRAGAICFIRYDHDVPSGELAGRLRVEEDVLVVPASHFGMEGYLRIGFGSRGPHLEEALGRVGALLDRFEGS